MSIKIDSFWTLRISKGARLQRAEGKALAGGRVSGAAQGGRCLALPGREGEVRAALGRPSKLSYSFGLMLLVLRKLWMGDLGKTCLHPV